MISHTKRRKIFYVPGMISLVLLPLLCLYHFYRNESFKEYRAINISWANEEYFQEFKKKHGFPIPRNYKEFVFNNSEALEKDKLKQMQLSLRALKKSNDTINGVKIHFGKRATYDVFIKVIDILGIEEEMPFYVNYKSDLWVVMPNKYKEQKADKEQNLTMNCGTQDIMRADASKLREIERENEKEEFQISYFKQKWPLLLAYLGILILNILALVKFNKNRKYHQKSYL